MAESDERIVRSLERVWQTPKDLTIDIIQHLDNRLYMEGYFLRRLEFLTPLEKKPNGKIIIKRSENNITENVLVDSEYGEGKSGKVALSAKKLVYKEIRIERAAQSVMERAVREVFLESFIQSTLCTDERFYKNIPHISQLCRSTKTPDSEIVLYIVMQNVPIAMKTLFTRQVENDRTKLIGIHDLLPILIKVGTILSDLQKAYGFSHRDLHYGNILLLEDGSPQIIDFGKSCLAINGVTYSLNRGRCKSHDLLILVISLLEFEHNRFDDELKNILMNVLISDGGVNFYNCAWITKSVSDIRYVFHGAYDYTINRYWLEDDRNELENAPLLNPENFAYVLKDVLDDNTESDPSPTRLKRQAAQRTLNISRLKKRAGYRKTRRRN